MGATQSNVAALVASLVALAAVMGWNVWKSELIRRPATKSIAVLPFENRSEDKANAYFADGIQDEILTPLIEDRRFKGDLAHIHAALQKRAEKSARDRQATWRRPHSGRKRAKERRRRARERAADQSSQ